MLLNGAVANLATIIHFDEITRTKHVDQTITISTLIDTKALRVCNNVDKIKEIAESISRRSKCVEYLKKIDRLM